MGAALTYARRYALFTLVGIAGEDDLDAPDLCIPAPAENSPRRGAEVQHSPNTSGNGGVSGRAKITPSPVLAADQSTVLRDSLINEIASLQSEGSAAEWARAALPRKNQLTAADARMVETAFALKQSAFALSLGAEPSPQDVVVSSAAETSTAAGTISSQTFTDAAADRPAAETVASAAVHAPGADQLPAAESLRMRDSTFRQQRGRVDKTVLTISTLKRHRDKEHLRFVAQQTCVLCGRRPAEAHHLRFAQPRTLGRKSSDEFAVPLCRSHHRAAHRAGDEKAWWQQAGIDPLKIARKLWKVTRLGEPRIRPATPILTPSPAAERAAAADEQASSGEPPGTGTRASV